MPLREVKPFDDKQWAQITTELKAGPTEESIRIVKAALDLASKLKEGKPSSGS